jgi:hypothetical protein
MVHDRNNALRRVALEESLNWWRREDSNLRPTDYETVALTT